ncbi:MAG: helix-turn-helix domain-containing protein [Endozoicomonas sp.]
MKSSSATTEILVTSTGNIVPFIEYCEKRMIDWRSIASECGIPIELMTHQQWLPTRQLMMFLHGLEKKHGFRVAIDVGRQVTVEQLSSELAQKASQCTSFEESIQCLVSEANSLNNHITIWPEKIGHQWWLCHRGHSHPSAPGFEQAEWFRTLAIINYCRIFSGKQWSPHSIKMISTDKSADKLPGNFRKSKIDFHQSFGAIAVQLPEQFQPLQLQEIHPDWHNAVARLIKTYAALPRLNIQWFAQMLGVSGRTLQRNLNKQGVHFKAIKEGARLERAIDLLINTRLSVQDIAWRVGYSDLSNFNRAFKGWTRMTAPAYRKTKASSVLIKSNDSEA